MHHFVVKQASQLAVIPVQYKEVLDENDASTYPFFFRQKRCLSLQKSSEGASMSKGTRKFWKNNQILLRPNGIVISRT